MNQTLKLSKQLSFGEEIANAVTHAIGAVIMLILLPISAIYSYEEHGILSAVGVSIFVISLFYLMNNWLGYLIIGIQWGTTILGILYKIFTKKVNEKFSLALYLIMGWLVILIIPQIIGQTGPIFWGMMLAGGLCYTVGAGFYAKKKPYFHMIWHLFILAASALQYLAIVYFM